MQKPFVIKGVGAVTLYDLLSGEEVLRILKQESATWTFAVGSTDVFGGDSLDILDSFETDRAQSVTFNENRFDPRQLEVATGKKPTQALSQPFFEMNEDGTVPDSPGPYTKTLAFATACNEATVRIRFAADDATWWEDLAPVPQTWAAGNIAEINSGAGIFPSGASIDVRITAVLTSGIESVATAQITHVIAAAVNADLQVTLPDHVLTIPPPLPLFDVTTLQGFNIYVDDGVAPEYLSNAAPIAAGGTHTIVATPGAGAGAPDLVPTATGQFTATAGVVTYAAADAGKGMLVDYVWTTSAVTAECTIADIYSNCRRGYLSALWRFNMKAPDGTIKGVQMEIYKMKYDGDYMLEFARTDAAKHAMAFKIFDPDRADKKVVGFKFTPLPAVAGC